MAAAAGEGMGSVVGIQVAGPVGSRAVGLGSRAVGPVGSRAAGSAGSWVGHSREPQGVAHNQGWRSQRLAGNRQEGFVYLQDKINIKLWPYIHKNR